MAKPKIAFVVGHSDWGKSKTLRALTNGNYWIKRTKINGVEFFVRRMSNDDLPDSFIRKMKSMNPAVWPHIIAALCPNFDDAKVSTRSILSDLRGKGYQLFFWVIQCQHGTDEVVSPGELALLRQFGKVEVFADRSEAEVRAKRFASFIKNVVLV